MPPLECANFLECENKTVCVAPFDFPHGSNTNFFHHIPENYHTHPSPCWAYFLFFFYFWSFLAKMAWNAIVCETTDVSRETATLPIFQKTWFQAILAKKKRKKKKKKNEKQKKKKKRENYRVRRFYGVRRSCRVRGFYSMCTSLAVECDALAGVRRICGMRRIPSMRGWYRDHIGKFRGQNQNSNPKASPNFQGHTSGFYFSEFTLGEVPGKKLANFYSANL